MKRFLVCAALLAAIAGFLAFRSVPHQVGGGSQAPFTYVGSTQATSSVGVYSWTNILSADSSRRYVTFCNNSITSNDAMYLSFGTASTTANSPAKPYGYRLPSGSCYEMNSDKLYYGDIYAIASTATATILTLKANNQY